MNNNILEVDNLTIKFGDAYALKDVHFQIEKGWTVSIIGPNGAGKSTLIKSILGLLPYSSGEIRLFGARSSSESLKLIGYIPQFKTIDVNFPAKAVELVASKLIGKWTSVISKKARMQSLAALDRFSSLDLADRQISSLSGGELQRVFLARATAVKPLLLILDEPATGIDAIGEIDMYNLLDSYQKSENATVLMVTHDWEAAYHHSSHVLLLNKTVICFDAPIVAFEGENLRKAFGHMGHRHEMKIGVLGDARNI